MIFASQSGCLAFVCVNMTDKDAIKRIISAELWFYYNLGQAVLLLKVSNSLYYKFDSLV